VIIEPLSHEEWGFLMTLVERNLVYLCPEGSSGAPVAVDVESVYYTGDPGPMPC
jgi:hypothetical protein